MCCDAASSRKSIDAPQVVLLRGRGGRWPGQGGGAVVVGFEFSAQNVRYSMNFSTFF